MRGAALLLAALVLAGCGSRAATPESCLSGAAQMARIEGGDFLMGAAAMRPEEGPARKVQVKPFWIDRTEVTNAQFARFVEATGYRTLAERGLSKARYPQLTDQQRRPASLVFVGAKARRLDDPGLWWRIVPGADWRHPRGPGSSIKDKAGWPVVHIAYEDALAYARWLGRDLPTEAEWEYAARGGLEARRYVWGDQPQDPKHPRANTWQGVFPVVDTGGDGHEASAAPVGCYEPNGYGLYDMAGNVWEWTRDPAAPGAGEHVIKGGSFLCSDDFCFRYRPAARTAGPPDSGASHIGFRTVKR
ncbi:MAG TPA: formylglycine-generating enzyme family protein [Caulobacteraceae bacterium]